MKRACTRKVTALRLDLGRDTASDCCSSYCCELQATLTGHKAQADAYGFEKRGKKETETRK